MIEFSEIEIDTKEKIEFMNMTKAVQEKVDESGIKNGFAVVFTQHTTAAVKVHETETEADRALIKDSLEFLERIASSEGNYRHDKSNVDGRPNTHAHLKSLMLNSAEVIPLREGKLLLGTWQSLYFIEMDGPRRKRKVIVEIVGEK